MMYILYKNKRGFTLIEALIAVTILTLSVVGPLVTANRSIVAARTARDQLTASYLAQEGIEHVRAMRDNAYLTAYQAGGSDVSTTAWNTFLNTYINQCRGFDCTLDPSKTMGSGINLSLQPCAGTCAPLQLTPIIGGAIGYTQSGGTVTPFTRTIQTQPVDAIGVDERIISTVTWSYHGTQYAITIYDHLTPWQ